MVKVPGSGLWHGTCCKNRTKRPSPTGCRGRTPGSFKVVEQTGDSGEGGERKLFPGKDTVTGPTFSFSRSALADLSCGLRVLPEPEAQGSDYNPTSCRKALRRSTRHTAPGRRRAAGCHLRRRPMLQDWERPVP